MQHPTSVPRQRRTRTFTVTTVNREPNHVIGRPEVPVYSQPTSHGALLDYESLRELAVHRAIERNPNFDFEDVDLARVITNTEEPGEVIRVEEVLGERAIWDPME